MIVWVVFRANQLKVCATIGLRDALIMLRCQYAKSIREIEGI